MELEYSNNSNTSDSTSRAKCSQRDASTPASIPTERDHTFGKYPYLNWKTDYTRQFGTSTKFESGLKVTRRTTSNDFDAAYLNATTGAYEPAPSRTTAFDYHEDIGAGYLLLSNRIKKFQTQSGLRLENAATYLDLTTVGKQYDRRYASAYPSAIVSYNFTQFRQGKISYSRRVSRPNPFQLSPIENRQDTRNVFRGNPELRAEYTDALEMGYQEARPWGSIQVNPYLRRTSHAVRNIQFVDTTGVSVSTYDNVASTLTVGTDVNVNARHGPLQLGGGASLYHYSSDASNLSRNLSAQCRGVVGENERDVEILAARGRASVRRLSRAVCDRGRIAARVGVDEPGEPLQGVGRAGQHFAAGVGSVQAAEVRLPHGERISRRVQPAILRDARGVPHDHAQFWDGAQAAAQAAGSGCGCAVGPWHAPVSMLAGARTRPGRYFSSSSALRIDSGTRNAEPWRMPRGVLSESLNGSQFTKSRVRTAP